MRSMQHQKSMIQCKQANHDPAFKFKKRNKSYAGEQKLTAKIQHFLTKILNSVSSKTNQSELEGKTQKGWISNCIRKQPTTDLNKELREKAPIFQKKHRVLLYFNLIGLLYVPFIQEMESKRIDNKQSPECNVL